MAANELDYRLRLMYLRIDNDLQQKEIADLCGVSPKTVSGWENCRSHIPVPYLIKLCRYYQVSANYIFGLPEYPPPPLRR